MELKMSSQDNAPKWLIIAAFAAVYLIWGSTYLGIKYAIETLPPFLMAGFRFTLAGMILYIFTFFQKLPAPTPVHWKNAFILGALLILCGNGIVVWAEQFIDSGVAALLIGLEPIWIVVLLWLFSGQRPSLIIIIGIMLGIFGMILLTGFLSGAGFHQVDARGITGICISTLAWALGSLYSLKAKVPSSSLQATGMQMLAGGILLIVTGSITGEWDKAQFENFSQSSIMAFLYLSIMGSLVAFTAYNFLLKHAHPSHVSTYAYVNPVIAIYLGWALADEQVTLQTIIASALLIGSVMVLTRYSKEKK